MDTAGRKRAKVTLAAVARHAGVSVTTASFVLSGRTDMRISTATADRVVQTARVLGYRPIPGGSVAPSQGPVIGFVTDALLSENFGAEMLRGGISAATSLGHGVITAETGGQRHMEHRVIGNMLDQGVEHFVYSTLSTSTLEIPAQLIRRHTVALNCIDTQGAVPAVVPNEQEAGRLAVETLVRAGHDNAIWLVGETGEGASLVGRLRHTAILGALAHHGLRLARQVPCLWWPPDAKVAFTQALWAAPQNRRPTAVIALNDRVAMGVYQVAADAGLAIPADLSVISFDNSDLAWWLDPGLTSIGIPYYDMGRRAVELVLADDRPTTPELFTMPLHERESIASSAGVGVAHVSVRNAVKRSD